MVPTAHRVMELWPSLSNLIVALQLIKANWLQLDVDSIEHLLENFRKQAMLELPNCWISGTTVYNGATTFMEIPNYVSLITNLNQHTTDIRNLAMNHFVILVNHILDRIRNPAVSANYNTVVVSRRNVQCDGITSEVFLQTFYETKDLIDFRLHDELVPVKDQNGNSIGFRSADCLLTKDRVGMCSNCKATRSRWFVRMFRVNKKINEFKKQQRLEQQQKQQQEQQQELENQLIQTPNMYDEELLL